MFMSEHKLMVFEGDGGRVASNYWSCLGLLCVRGALRLFEREKRVVTITAHGGRLTRVCFCVNIDRTSNPQTNRIWGSLRSSNHTIYLTRACVCLSPLSLRTHTHMQQQNNDTSARGNSS